MSSSKLVESKLDPARAVYDFTLPAGEPWLHEIKKGQVFRILDLEGNQAVDTLFYNARRPAERYSAQDTLAAQGSIYLTASSRLMSNEGNVMLTIVADTCRRHATLGGARGGRTERLDQARHRHQHQLLHGRAGDAGRWVELRRRRVGAGQIR